MSWVQNGRTFQIPAQRINGRDQFQTRNQVTALEDEYKEESVEIIPNNQSTLELVEISIGLNITEKDDRKDHYLSYFKKLKNQSSN